MYKIVILLLCLCVTVFSCLGCTRTEKPAENAEIQTETILNRPTEKTQKQIKKKPKESAETSADENEKTVVSETSPAQKNAEKSSANSGSEAEDDEDTVSEVGIIQSVKQDTAVKNPQRPMGNDHLHIYRYLNDIGSSRTLSGNITVHCFFVDDDETCWTQSECERFLNRQIVPGLDFIKNQGESWGIQLDFKVKSYCGETEDFSLKYNGTVNTNLMEGGATTDILEQIAANMGYSSASDFVIYDDKNDEHTDAVYLTVIKKTGRSYTVNLYNEENSYYLDDDIAEHCVIFAGDGGFAFPYRNSSTVAHEILHLFGAEDYYGQIRLPIANEYYYYDIMTLNTYNIKRLEVGSMTAFTVGWTDEIPELCYDEIWIESRFETE